MKRFIKLGIMTLTLTLLLLPAGTKASEMNKTVKAELRAIEKIFVMMPQAAIDKREASGTMCMNVGFGRGGHMTHFSTNPESSTNDIIDFIDARPLIEAGLDGTKLPRLPKKAGTLTPGKWYFHPAGVLEPFHNSSFPMPILVKAVDVK